MKLLSIFATLAWLATAVCPPVATADDDFGTVAEVEELQVLDRLRGQWNGTLDAGNSSLKQTSRWILDGRVLETKFQLDGTFQGLLLRTYDAEDEEYVATYMDAIGTVVHMTGSWDEDQQTLTTTGENAGQTVTLSTRFLDERTTKWAISQTTAGTEAKDLGGTNQRISN